VDVFLGHSVELSLSKNAEILTILTDESVLPLQRGARCFMPKPSSAITTHTHTVAETVKERPRVTFCPVEPRCSLIGVWNRQHLH